MAVKIERVEREFILVSAAEAGMEARIQVGGNSVACRIKSAAEGRLELMPVSGPVPRVPNRVSASVYFDFRGQGVAFTAPVLQTTTAGMVLSMPEAMYRSLSRRWPRVPPPRDFSVEFLLPDAELKLDCPQSEEWVEVELPELREGLDSRNLAVLVDSFKNKAGAISSEGRVVMYKDKGPVDIAEEMVSKLGRVLFVPSTLSQLPLADPYPVGRIVTREMAEDFEGPVALAGGSRLSAYLSKRAAEGLSSAVWCPVIYYRYTIGMVHLANFADRPRALDFAAVDLAWEFSRVLAWFLKRHGYFSEGTGTSSVDSGAVVDASPTGMLVVLPSDGPRFNPGASIRLRLTLGGTSIPCVGRLARRYDQGGTRYYGFAFQDLAAIDMASIARGLYGESDSAPRGEGG